MYNKGDRGIPIMQLDTIFYREFMETMRINRARFQEPKVMEFPIPESVSSPAIVSDKILIKGLSEEYYSKLNGAECYLFRNPKLVRRKFNSKGFIKENGAYVYEPVPVPRGMTVILSPTNVRVPYGFQSKVQCEYVDFGNVRGRKFYIYIVPKDNCYIINQVALVLSARPLRNHYGGVSFYTWTGYMFYLYLVPYKPDHGSKYRVLRTRESLNFPEMRVLIEYWVKETILPNPRLTEVDPLVGVSNCTLRQISGTLDDYVRYNPDSPLSLTGNTVESIISAE